MYIIFFFFGYFHRGYIDSRSSEGRRYFCECTMYLAMSESTPDFFWHRLKLALGRVSTRRIIDNVEACHLAEWEQEQPLCLFLLAPLSRPDQILGSNPAVPITIAAPVTAVVDSTIIVEDPFPRHGIELKVCKFKNLLKL